MGKQLEKLEKMPREGWGLGKEGAEVNNNNNNNNVTNTDNNDNDNDNHNNNTSTTENKVVNVFGGI